MTPRIDVADPSVAACRRPVRRASPAACRTALRASWRAWWGRTGSALICHYPRASPL